MAKLPQEVSDDIVIKRHDSKRTIVDTLYLNDGAAVLNLSGSTVLLVRQNTKTGVTTKVTASIVTPESGSVYYQLTDSDVQETGSYWCEWQANYLDGTQITSPTTQYFLINIKGDLENE